MNNSIVVRDRQADQPRSERDPLSHMRFKINSKRAAAGLPPCQIQSAKRKKKKAENSQLPLCLLFGAKIVNICRMKINDIYTLGPKVCDGTGMYYTHLNCAKISTVLMNIGFSLRDLMQVAELNSIVL